MFAYFEEMHTFVESKKCWSEFSRVFKKNTSRDYSKSDPQLYRLLYEKGNEQRALSIAKQRYNNLTAENLKFSEMYSCTTVFKIVQKIRDKVKNARAESLN